MGVLILGSGIVGLLGSVVVITLSIIAMLFCRSTLDRGPWLMFALLGLVGVILIGYLGLASFPASRQGAPTAQDYESAMKGMFLLGFSPGGLSLGLMSLFFKQ